MRFAAGVSLAALCLSAQAAAPDARAGADRWVVAPALNAVNSRGIAAVSPEGGAPPTIFDSFTGGNTFILGNEPRSFMASPFTVAGSGGAVTIEEATVYLASPEAQSYSNGLLIRIQFWENYRGESQPVFSNAVGALQTFTVPGPISIGALMVLPVNVTFATPVTLVGTANNGFAINWQGDNGAGPVSLERLTSLVRRGAALSVGTFTDDPPNFVTPEYGFYRNVSGQTNFNHAPTDLTRFVGFSNVMLAVQFRGGVTPVELQSFSVE